MIRIGNRVPRHYFETTGTGQSDITVHAGSYHLALRDAEIEMANIMTYSSILPGTATLLGQRPRILHGSVMETISAVAHSTSGLRATAGIIYAWLTDPRTDQRYGGLVCEYGGDLDIDEAQEKLWAMLNELYFNGYAHFLLGEPHYLMSSITPTKRYGTALAALCFTDYDIPVIEEKP